VKVLKCMAVVALIGLPVAGLASDEITNVTWTSSISLGATVKQGNTEKTLYTLNFKADRRAPESDWISSVYGEYGITENKETRKDEQTEGQLRGQSEYRHKFGNKRWFGGLFAETYHDALKQIRYRVKGGPNVGYYFIDKKHMTLDASIGVNAVHEKTVNDDRNYAEYRAAANYLWNITDTSSYYLNVEYTANVEDVDDGNGLLVTGLKSKIKDNLSMFVELRDEYDNIPDGEDVEHNDITLLAGLTYDFL